MTNIEELLKSCLGAIRSFQLAYPSFKPSEDVIEFWTESLMESKLEPEDIVGGVKMFLDTETNSFNVNLPTLISYCKRVRSKKLKKIGESNRALARTTEKDEYNLLGKSEFAKASMEAQRVLHASYNPNASAIYKETINELHKKHGIPIPEWD